MTSSPFRPDLERQRMLVPRRDQFIPVHLLTTSSTAQMTFDRYQESQANPRRALRLRFIHTSQTRRVQQGRRPLLLPSVGVYFDEHLLDSVSACYKLQHLHLWLTQTWQDFLGPIPGVPLRPDCHCWDKCHPGGISHGETPAVRP